MSHKFSIKTASLFASLGVVAAFALVSPIKEAEAGDDKVPCEKLTDGVVQKFCNTVQGKEASIKRVMKDAEKAYKKAGKGDIDCKTCHEGSNGGPLIKAKVDSLWGGYKPFVETAIKEYETKAEKK
jgi:hypothetical protein